MLIVAGLSLAFLTSALWVANWVPGDPLPEGARADRIVVEKAARRLTLFSKGCVLKTYSIALGTNPVGAKEKEGDCKTPEGLYTIDGKIPEGTSLFHMALRISYPNSSDLSRPRKPGELPGGDIVVHGLTNGLGWIGRLHRLRDWTRGCIAITNPEIEEIYLAVNTGTPVEIRR